MAELSNIGNANCATISRASVMAADPGNAGHRVWDFRTALMVARELERLGAVWLEEPLPRNDLTGLARGEASKAVGRFSGGSPP